MANLNKVMLIGRLTHDVETRSFASGGKVAKVRLAVTNRRKNAQTGEWEDSPMYIDCEAYNRGESGKQADLCEQYLAKGKQVFVEGRLELDQWDDSNSGQKRSKHKLVVENIQFLDPKPQQEEAAQPPKSNARGSRKKATVPDSGEQGDDSIPF